MFMGKTGSNLRKARKAKNDEFYTQLSDIENELSHYKEHFKNKVVFCNCDDPEESMFWLYFSRNFEYLGLKKLIATHYEENKPSYKLELFKDINDDGKINQLDVVKTSLKQNGDFKSPESITILKEADIVVTNPPFSLFREYVAQLMEYDKKFLIVGNMNAITYKEFFPLLKDNKVWRGHDLLKEFAQPDGSIKKFGNICWFTNLKHKKRNEDIILYKTYKGNESDYPKYDNYDAINVDKVKDIPMDYDGVMGVPITFIGSYNPEQFEIIGQGRSDLCSNMTNMSQQFVDDYYKAGGTGCYKKGNPLLGYYDKNGKATVPYMRILIKKKANKKEASNED
jgi:hypothetical protein